MIAIAPVYAVHLSDGVLSWPWLLMGFAIAGALALLASWRLSEEEIPRVAVMASAFFVASSIHVKLGPTSVHLLLGGLVGVVLGLRAPLAILLGITLQAILIPHGGITTIGINSTMQMLPALACAALFPILRQAACRHALLRSGIVGLSALAWGAAVLLGVALLVRNANSAGLLRWSEQAGMIVELPAWESLLQGVGTGPILAGMGLFVGACVLVERRYAQGSEKPQPEFAVGVFLGVFAVLTTTLLLGTVLLLDGREQWGTFVSLVFLAHLPLALVEGLILGSMITFLARVKPQMLRLTPTPAIGAMLLLVMVPTMAHAHALEGEAKVDAAKRTVQVSCWYETGDAPEEGKVRVLREDDSVVVQGSLKAGAFSFSYDKIEPLRILIDAPGGHRTTIRLRVDDLKDTHAEVGMRAQDRSRLHDVVLGITFLLALSAFVMSWRNGAKLRKMGEGHVSS
jgi:cobalt/nickel transport system permease protein